MLIGKNRRLGSNLRRTWAKGTQFRSESRTFDNLYIVFNVDANQILLSNQSLVPLAEVQRWIKIEKILFSDQKRAP